jgi:hypothetical protein
LLSRSGANPPFVPDPTGEAPLAEQLLEAGVDLGHGAKRLVEAVEPVRDYHELLKVHVVGRVGAAVQDVGAGNGQGVGASPAEVAVQGERRGFGRRLRRRQGDTKDSVRPKAALVLGSVGLDHGEVEGALVGGVQAHDHLR